MTHFARKHRRGLGLLDVILSLAIIVAALGLVFEYLKEQNTRRGERLEAVNLSMARSVLASYVNRNALDLVAAVPLNSARKINTTDIDADGLSLDASLLSGRDGRPIDMWVVHEAGSVLTYFARASGAIDTPHYPRPDPTLGLLGSLTEEDPDHIRGIGVTWAVAGHAGFTPILNDVFAFGQLDFDADVLPYLHRADVIAPDGTALSRMDTDLDLGTNDIINANNVSLTGDFSTLGTIAARAMTLTGGLTAETLAVSDTLDITNDLTAGSLIGQGTVTLDGDMTILGRVDVGQVNVTGDAEFQTLTTAGPLTADEANVTTTLYTADAEIADTMTVTGTLSANSVVGDSMSIAGTLTSTNGIFNTITTGECTGC